MLSFAERAAYRRSHPHAQPRPAPAQAPLIAATVTCGISWSMTGTSKYSSLFGSFGAPDV